MYKQMILAICFATVSLFSIPQAKASTGHSETLFSKVFHLKTDKELLSMVMQLDDAQLATGLTYLHSKGLSKVVIQKFQNTISCDDCVYYAQAAYNQAFQASYAQCGDVFQADLQGQLQEVCAMGDCIQMCSFEPSIAG